MKHCRPVLVLLAIAGFLLCSANLTAARAQAALPMVHAVLFYSPTCPHCHYVITEILPPLMDKYGDQLQIIGIDVTQPDGQVLFLSALQMFNVETGGVPFLVIGDTFLVGSADIPQRLPGLIDANLAQGGVAWPDIPGLRNMLAQRAATESAKTPAVPATIAPSSVFPAEAPGLSAIDGDNPNWRTNFAGDVPGNTLAVLILAGMLGAIAWVVMVFRQPDAGPLKSRRDWIIPMLCILGIGVAAYLAYVESAQVSAVCGPVGDCNTVQQSEYARLFGVLPIGILGVVGYLVIAIGWLIGRFANIHLADLATLSLLVITALGTLFSVYLTFLEPFIIGATCAWCLTSAVVMTILMVISVRPGKAAATRLLNF